jgi:hypothetical protein
MSVLKADIKYHAGLPFSASITLINPLPRVPQDQSTGIIQLVLALVNDLALNRVLPFYLLLLFRGRMVRGALPLGASVY